MAELGQKPPPARKKNSEPSPQGQTSRTDIDACAAFADALIPRPVFADYGYVRDRERVIPL
jgi:hypothetical protein